MVMMQFFAAFIFVVRLLVSFTQGTVPLKPSRADFAGKRAKPKILSNAQLV
jgi:hypothetical protein